MVTSRGIYYDLNETLYTYRLKDLKFYFSSKKYRDKFIKESKDFCKLETYKLEQRYSTILLNDEFFLILLYNKIEKRGFQIEVISKKRKLYTMPSVRIDFLSF